MKTCQFYAVGVNERELLAYDEYSSMGSGLYFTSDLMMIERYNMAGADEEAKTQKLATFLVTITKDEDVLKTEVAVMRSVDEVQNEVRF